MKREPAYAGRKLNLHQRCEVKIHFTFSYSDSLNKSEKMRTSFLSELPKLQAQLETSTPGERVRTMMTLKRHKSNGKKIFVVAEDEGGMLQVWRLY